MQIRVDRLKTERALLLDLFVRQLKILSKRANLPEERIALAELERTPGNSRTLANSWIADEQTRR